MRNTGPTGAGSIDNKSSAAERHRAARRITRVVPLLLSLAVLAGCGSNDGVVDPGVAVRVGWDSFAAGDYARAEDSFLAAAAVDARRAEAHTGTGWSRAYRGDLDGAASSFLEALTLSRKDPDALAGLAAVRLTQGDIEDAVTRARAALDRSPAWTFAHKAGVNALDLHLIIAQASALRGAPGYTTAQAELDILDETNGLDPAAPATWHVSGVTYGSYGEALLAALETVERDVGATIP